jgi:hypothetical protein
MPSNMAADWIVDLLPKEIVMSTTKLSDVLRISSFLQ